MADPNPEAIHPCPFCGGECECITTDEGARVVCCLSCNWTYRYAPGDAVSVHDAIAPSRWIPVEDGLPDPGDDIFEVWIVGDLEGFESEYWALARRVAVNLWSLLWPNPGLATLDTDDLVTHYRPYVTPRGPK